VITIAPSNQGIRRKLINYLSPTIAIAIYIDEADLCLRTRKGGVN